MARSQLVDEDLHASTIDVRQDQAVKLTVCHRHGRIGVGVLVRNHGVAHRPDGARAPAAARVRDAPEARLVGKHHAQPPAAAPAISGKELLLASFRPCASGTPVAFEPTPTADNDEDDDDDDDDDDDAEAGLLEVVALLESMREDALLDDATVVAADDAAA